MRHAVLAISFFFLLFLTDFAFGQASTRITIKEQDGAPSLSGVHTIEVSNGSLTSVGSGVIELQTGPGSGSGATAEVNGAGNVAHVDFTDTASVTWGISGGTLTATSTGAGGAGETKNGGSFGQLASGSGTTTALSASTYALLNSVTGGMTENYDLGSNLVVSATKIEICYTGTDTVGAYVQMIGSMDGSTDTVVDLDMGFGPADVSHADASGEVTQLRVYSGAAGDEAPFYLARSASMAENDCVGLMIKGDASESAIRVRAITLLISLDDNWTRAPGTGYADIGSISATGGDGRSFPVALAKQGAGVWFIGNAAGEHVDNADGPGLDTFIFGDPRGISSPYPFFSQGLLSGTHDATVEIWSKSSANKALKLRDSGVAGKAPLLEIVNNQSTVMEIGSDAVGGYLAALGYVDGSSMNPVAGITSDFNSVSNNGRFVVSTEPTTAGDGGGYCISSQTTAYNGVAAMLADSLCIALDSSEVGTFAQGHPFIDENRDGTKNGNDLYLGTGALATAPVHLSYYIEGPVSGSTFEDLDRVRFGFTVGEIACKTDQGTIPINIQIDGSLMLGSDLVCDSTASGAVTNTFGGAQGSSLSTDDWIDLKLGTASNNPGVITIIIDQ